MGVHRDVRRKSFVRLDVEVDGVADDSDHAVSHGSVSYRSSWDRGSSAGITLGSGRISTPGGSPSSVAGTLLMGWTFQVANCAETTMISHGELCTRRS